ncbi:hypothetical protein K438DRAFT_2149417 [Mycena galopus ATCC 62051]|nr:hypothetical protein K438DRAFT_2149417 [Mycena galopus ATCC 62051]
MLNIYLFSELGGIQIPHRNGWLVETMEKAGRIRGHLSHFLLEKKNAEGKSTQRKHAHMHTRPELGIDSELAQSLANPITWIPCSVSTTMRGMKRRILFKELTMIYRDRLQSGIGSRTRCCSSAIGCGWGNDQFGELDRVDRGEMDAPLKEVIEIVGDDAPGSWNVEGLI